MLKRLSPQEARTRLGILTQQASNTQPNLAQKLTALSKWIKDKKDGLLTSKPYVLDLLTEIILDVELWLILSAFSPEDRQELYASENFSVTEQYWFDVLFPRWINDQDPKFPTWKREVMNGNFKREDESILRDLTREIEGRGGSYLWKHLLDLSMATDLLASGQQEATLCVQLTTLSEPYLTEKRQSWEATLQYWDILWGLLVSYNPMGDALTLRLAEDILRCSDAPTANGYNLVTNL
ncbi:hypothetical protein [Spirulina major]|uniref:hypothetical protein n=1 Tax=Spirulina major TaxID=270636 RepID=UPI0011148E08|nr:hypothetical protein [Spirulina major]